MSDSIRTLSTVALSSTICILLAACSGDGKDAQAPRTDNSDARPATAPAPAASRTPAAKVAVANIAEGPDVCFRAIAKHLGADVKVSEVISFFSSGSEIDSNDDEPKGQMTTCTVQYQNPDDPRKLLSTTMNMKTGEFDEPRPLEITVMGNAADFRLEDHLIPLSKVNAASLSAVMEAQKADLERVYSQYAWSGVRLESPGMGSPVHLLRLDTEGRLAANDVKKSGYASISLDGSKVVRNHLLP